MHGPARDQQADQSINGNKFRAYIPVPIAISAENFLLEAIPGVPVSMLNGHRGLSQLDPLHIAFAGGRREVLHACSRVLDGINAVDES